MISNADVARLEGAGLEVERLQYGSQVLCRVRHSDVWTDLYDAEDVENLLNPPAPPEPPEPEE